MRQTIWLFLGLSLFLLGSLPVQAEEQKVNEEIIYKIMVDRYNNGDSNNDQQVDIDDPDTYHGGDLQGIIQRLGELEQTGVTTISLSPIMANAENGYHGYWIEDFQQIEEQYGTMEDLHQLIDEAHQHDIKVVLEFVTNYAAEDHPLSVESAASALAGEDVDPTWAEQAAVLDQEDERVRNMLREAADFWMEETDIDGFYLHAADQASMDFLADFTQYIKGKDEEFYLFGNILAQEDSKDILMENTEVDAVDNLHMQEVLRETFAEVDQPITEVYEVWEENGRESDIVFMDTFYTDRFTQIFAENGRNNLTAWTLALTYLYTSPGVPAILQGTELPMYGEGAEGSQRLVPHNSGEPEVKEFHDRISSLREEFDVLVHGDFELAGSSGAMSVFKRTFEGETMYIAINNGSESGVVPLSEVGSGKQLRGYLADNIVREDENGNHKIGIPRESVEVYAIEPDAGLNWSLIGFAGGVILLFTGGVVYLSLKQRKRKA
ncbi:alpha-amylase family glycosyl hydrolase [Virgibacillus xinjiangensis]|uniref:Alpha-amylase family glycosyl hydrolase n=1 Tax=Virgibacillus xinjiangensis TaxID=393090 RepID=A0ABV7CWA9_9BACI